MDKTSEVNKEVEWWAGKGGDAYMDRCAIDPATLLLRRKTWEDQFRIKDKGINVHRVLEIGPGPGLNLLAIHDLSPDWELVGVEPNETARKRLKTTCPFATILDGHAGDLSALKSADFDFVFTAGVLIHIEPSKLKAAMSEIARVSRFHVFAVEYFAPKCEPIEYHGEVRLWRNNFGKLYRDLDLKEPWLNGHGFWSDLDGFDNCVWWDLWKNR